MTIYRFNRLFLLLLLVAVSFLGGCDRGVLDPQGPVGTADKAILIDSVAIMLAIVVPTIIATLAFAWWFRASNTRATYGREFVYSGRIELIVWSIPLLVIMLLGGVIWIGSRELDPATPLASDTAPLEIQAVSLDWKWLFIYPKQRVASVNELVVPAGVPIHFSLTSASVMSAFFVPQLGSMIYTMNGMTTQLNLRADAPGTFLGEASHFSGDGFSDMHFDVKATPADQFATWIEAHAMSARPSTPQAMSPSPGRASKGVHSPSARLNPGCSRRSSHCNCRPDPARSRPTCSSRASGSSTRTFVRRRRISMLGNLTWAAIPFDEPIPLYTAAVSGWRSSPSSPGSR